ncbi:MAG: hypothetical protein ACR2PT_15615 [Endozoicomonas sp.]
MEHPDVRVGQGFPARHIKAQPAQKQAEQQPVKPDASDQSDGHRVDFIQRPEQKLDGVVDGAVDVHSQELLGIMYI